MLYCKNVKSRDLKIGRTHIKYTKNPDLIVFFHSLRPTEECVDIPKEVCVRAKVNPRKIKRPIVKKWCYTPKYEESENDDSNNNDDTNNNDDFDDNDDKGDTTLPPDTVAPPSRRG